MCNKAALVLGKDEDNVKALFRRGTARNCMGNPDEALVDLNRALELDADNKVRIAHTSPTAILTASIDPIE